MDKRDWDREHSEMIALGLRIDRQSGRPERVAFNCAICGDHQPVARFPGAVQIWDVPPICYACERTWGRRTPLPGAGSHRDKRMVTQIKALADIISATAYCIQQGHPHPYEAKR